MGAAWRRSPSLHIQSGLAARLSAKNHTTSTEGWSANFIPAPASATGLGLGDGIQKGLREPRYRNRQHRAHPHDHARKTKKLIFRPTVLSTPPATYGHNNGIHASIVRSSVFGPATCAPLGLIWSQPVRSQGSRSYGQPGHDGIGKGSLAVMCRVTTDLVRKISEPAVERGAEGRI